MDWQSLAETIPALRVPSGHPLPPRAPVTGAWREGDPPGNRQFAGIGDLTLDSGATLPSVRLAYETFGTLTPETDNVILLLHALTGDSHVRGPADATHPTEGWWSWAVGPGAPIDTDRYFVIVPNVLGGCQGSTGPASVSPSGDPWGGQFPTVTIRDQVRAQVALIRGLGIPRLAAIVGGSMGGMHALEWAIMEPDLVARIAVLAAPGATTADQIAANSVQIAAIRSDAAFHDGDYYDHPVGPTAGLSLARRMAMLHYRTADELDERFSRDWQSDRDPLLGGGRFAVESYLDFHGNRFTRRFDANSYLVLTEAMNSHDVWRGRDAGLWDRIRSRSLVLGITTDRYFPLAGQRDIARHLPHSVHGPEPVVVDAPYGHDAFLIAAEPVGLALRTLLNAHEIA